jgi:hypothetical protein
MRALLVPVLLLAACGPKAPPPPGPTAVTDAPVAPPAELEPPPEPEAPPPPAPNASFDVALTYADGRTVSGRVWRVERAIDFYGEQGFTDRAEKRTVALSGPSGARDAAWEELTEITIEYPADASGVSCEYDSATRPWMYTCTLPTTTTARTADGARWSVSTRNKWRLHVSGHGEVDLYLSKLPVRAPDDAASGYGSENHALYATLRDRVLEESRISVTRLQLTR